MENKLLPFVKYSQDRTPSNLPRLRLKISASDTLSLTLPFPILFTIEHESNPTGKPLIFEWSAHEHAFTDSGLVLLHHTADGFDVLAVDHSNLVDISRHGPLLVNGWNQDLWEAGPDRPVTFQKALPARFQRILRPGETYTLLWPGDEVALWEEGSVREHMGQELDNRTEPLVLPGGSHLTFTTNAASPPWPKREEREARVGFDRANLEEQKWRIEQQRVDDPFPPTQTAVSDADAPRLQVSLNCEPIIAAEGVLDITVKVSYEAPATARPITFHTRIFADSDNYQLGRLQNGSWKAHDDESDGGGFRIVDDPDVPVTVGQSTYFASLQPGEAWTTSQRVGYNWTELPSNAKSGETFRHVFGGATLDWWNWGPKAEHDGTVVSLPCYLTGPVVDPRDNDGRPRLVVPTSNVVEFSVEQ